MASREDPKSPILLRFVGLPKSPVGVNGDYFTVGDTGDENITLPQAMRGPATTRLRFSRGAEGWRVTMPDDRPFYVNQRRTTGLSPVESGDVVRFAPGGLGLQFTIRQQQDTSLAKLAARHAPTLLKQGANVGDDEQEPQDKSQGRRKHWAEDESAQAHPLPTRTIGVVLLVVVFALVVGYLIGSLR